MNFNFLDSGNILYTVYFFLLMVFVITRNRYSNKKNKRIFVLFIIVQLFLGCFRKEGVGMDTLTYTQIMEENFYDSYNQVFTEIHFNDPIFFLFLKFIYDPLRSYTFVFSFFQIVFWMSLGVLMYRYSGKCLLALFVFIFLKYHFNVWSAIRQGFALSILLWAYFYLLKENKKKFFMCIGIAAMAHFSAVLFLIAYPLQNMRLFERKWLMLLLTIFVLMLTPFLEILNILNFDVTGMLNEESSSNLFILVTTILTFIFVFFTYKPDGSKNNNLLFNLSFVAFLFAILGFRVTLGYRVLIYFGFFLSVMVSNNVAHKRWSDNKVLARLVIPMAIMYMLTGIPSSVSPYHFVWEYNVHLEKE